jgi:FATC domain
VIGVSSMPSPPLSVEGHAHRLIDEAVCKERLGKMYIWCVACKLRKWDSQCLLHPGLGLGCCRC